MKTVLLGVNTWDLVLDIGGNIAVASEPYALAQDAASACRTFKRRGIGECWYNTTLGVDYDQLLGKALNISLTKAKMVSQARLVPGVFGVKVFITGFADRVATGQIQITDENGTTETAAI